MFRRNVMLMAGSTLHRRDACSVPRRLRPQGKKITVAIPGIPPIYSVDHRLCRGEAGLLQEARRQRRNPPVRQRHRGGARGGRRRRRSRLVADPAGHQPDFQRRRSAGRGLRHAEPGLGDRHHRRTARPARTWSARTSASTRSTARVRWRCARCSPAARASRSTTSSRSRSARRRAGADRRPAALRRAASRRPRRDRASGQEAAHPAGDEEHQSDQPLPDAGRAQGQPREEPRRYRAHASPA